MTIGINAMAAVKQPRTGVEEYTYQLIKHLTMLPEAGEHRFFLYVPSFRKGGVARSGSESLQARTRRILNDEKISPNPSLQKRGEALFDFSLPPNFEIKILRWPLPFLWTQVRLAWEMLVNPPEIMFIPVHVLPFGSPKNSVVSVHGLEYEYFPKYYSWKWKMYLRWSTRRSAKRAKRIIAISENTKSDLVKLYDVRAEKISVVHHGVFFRHSEAECRRISHECGSDIHQRSFASLGMTAIEKPYLLYIGRIETKKNIQGILAAYKILKEEYKIPHELILAGSPGYGYNKLKSIIHNSLFVIQETGYVSEEIKWQLLFSADVFLFPSLYEGFGLPVLEAQAAGAPVITSFNSCLPEIAGEGALFVNPQNPAQIAEAVKQIIDDKLLRDKLIQLGKDNISLFSWEKCARETLEVIVNS